MELSKSYFAIPNLLEVIDRFFNEYCYSQIVILNGRNIDVRWTERAERAMRLRPRPLIVEMQLYFSCVVKKRLLFHDQSLIDPVVTVNDKLRLCYQPVQSAACDPEAFVRDYPAELKLKSKAAAKMQPCRLNIDFRKGHWMGDFYFGGNPANDN